MQPFLSVGRRVLGSTIPLRGSHGWGWYYRAKELQKVQKKPSNLWKNEEQHKRSKVYFDIGGDNTDSKRVVIELLDDIVPRTTQNFLNLIRGTNGLGYKNCTFFDIRKGEYAYYLLIDVLTNDLEDIRRSVRSTLMMKTSLLNILSFLLFLSFTDSHDIPGVVTMLNAGVHKNNSLFAISLKPLPHLDGRNVVVGHVVEGMDVIESLSNVFCYKGVPLDPVAIKDCGVLNN